MIIGDIVAPTGLALVFAPYDGILGLGIKTVEKTMELDTFTDTATESTFGFCLGQLGNSRSSDSPSYFFMPGSDVSVFGAPDPPEVFASTLVVYWGMGVKNVRLGEGTV
jgi:hypothetical protein